MTRIALFAVIAGFALPSLGQARTPSPVVTGEVVWVNPDKKMVQVRHRHGIVRSYKLDANTRIKFGEQPSNLSKAMIGHTIRIHFNQK